MNELLLIIGAVIASAAFALMRVYRFGPYLEDEEMKEVLVPESELDELTVPVEAPKQPQVETLLWDTREHIIHSIRVICDEEGLTWEQKNTLTATIGGESGYNTKAVNHNYVIRNGVRKIGSTDWGLCQWNDFYHGQEISGGFDGEAMNNPEKAVRLMCSYWKRGQRNLWIAYKNGSYKQYL